MAPYSFGRNCLSISAGLLALAMILAASGCSSRPKLMPVKGTLTYKGKPLPGKQIRFHGPEGHVSITEVEPDGSFVITDVLPGEVKVCIMDSIAERFPARSPSGGPFAAPQAASPVYPIPEKYKNPETSGLVYTITPETTELAITLE
jgi:hypothetical protein